MTEDALEDAYSQYLHRQGQRDAAARRRARLEARLVLLETMHNPHRGCALCCIPSQQESTSACHCIHTGLAMRHLSIDPSARQTKRKPGDVLGEEEEEAEVSGSDEDYGSVAGPRFDAPDASDSEVRPCAWTHAGCRSRTGYHSSLHMLQIGRSFRELDGQ